MPKTWASQEQQNCRKALNFVIISSSPARCDGNNAVYTKNLQREHYIEVFCHRSKMIQDIFVAQSKAEQNRHQTTSAVASRKHEQNTTGTHMKLPTLQHKNRNVRGGTPTALRYVQTTSKFNFPKWRLTNFWIVHNVKSYSFFLKQITKNNKNKNNWHLPLSLGVGVGSEREETWEESERRDSFAFVARWRQL